MTTNQPVNLNIGTRALKNKLLMLAEIALIKKMIWSYLVLLIFEGAIRRYVPGTASLFFIIRDPLAMMILYKVWRAGLWPTNIYIKVVNFIAIWSMISAVLWGHGNIIVAAYGARIFLIHFPLMFVVGKILDRTDVIKMAKMLLWISIPMVVLIAIQFYSPQTAWINRSIGDAGEGGRLTGALGFYRPPGTFSFTTGLTLFYGLVGGILLFFALETKGLSRTLFIGASFALIAAVPLSLSRGLLFQVIIGVLFAIFAGIRKPALVKRVIIGGVVASIVLVLLGSLSFFKESTMVFTERINNANATEGGVASTFSDRFLGGLVSAFESSNETPFFGYGIGMGTNLGSQLLTGGRAFLIAEGEWGRTIGELGLMLGGIMIFIRIFIVIEIIINCYKKMVSGDFLAWMLLSFGALLLAQGSWSQPTSLGFYVITGGLILASLKGEAKKPNFFVKKK